MSREASHSTDSLFSNLAEGERAELGAGSEIHECWRQRTQPSPPSGRESQMEPKGHIKVTLYNPTLSCLSQFYLCCKKPVHILNWLLYVREGGKGKQEP